MHYNPSSTDTFEVVLHQVLMKMTAHSKIAIDFHCFLLNAGMPRQFDTLYVHSVHYGTIFCSFFQVPYLIPSLF